MVEEIKQQSQSSPLDGYFRYIDPQVQHRTWEPLLNVEGFVDRRDPNTMYTARKGMNPAGTQAHEFEHTQQIKSGRKFDYAGLSDRWNLSEKLYPYFDKVPPNDPNYKDLTKDEYRKIHTHPREFLADLAGLFRTHQDPKIRQEIEDILKTSPYYEEIKKSLFPTLPHASETKQSSTPINTPQSLIDLARQWIRNKTAY